MHAVLEYLAVGVLITTLLLVSGYVMEAPFRTVETVKAEQLYTVAERLMDKILLTPGYPEHWGADLTPEDEIADFGLALAGATAPYIIDPDKVMRLANLTFSPNPVPVSARRIAELLGIYGAYGFRLEMKPMITATVKTIDSEELIPKIFSVCVVNWQNIGLPNANVTGAYAIAYADTGVGKGLGRKDESLPVYNRTCLTNSLGCCILDYRGLIGETQPAGGKSPVPFLILRIEWEGFLSVVGYSPRQREEEPVYGYVVGNYIFIEGLEVRGVFMVDDKGIAQVIPLYSNIIEALDVVWCRAQLGPEDAEFCHEVAGRVLPARRRTNYDYLVGYASSLEFLSSHIIVTGTWTRGEPASRKGIAVVISRIPYVDIMLGPKEAQPVNTVTITRVAQIYGYPYVIRLTLWRWVEGWP